jgi:hypothetical protein
MLPGLEWSADWGIGIPMIMASIAFHVSGLVGIEWLLITIEKRRRRPRSIRYFLALTLLVANIIMIMHALEAMAWGILYLNLGALADFRTAILYSLNALTSYGHESTALADPWRLLGAIESMDGVMIFGLTTAFLFNILRELRPVRQS